MGRPRTRCGPSARRASGPRTTTRRYGRPRTTPPPVWPSSDDPADVAAADYYDVLWNRMYAEPVLLGSYPEGIAELMPGAVNADLGGISSALAFYGVNYYTPVRVADPASPADAVLTKRLEDAPF